MQHTHQHAHPSHLHNCEDLCNVNAHICSIKHTHAHAHTHTHTHTSTYAGKFVRLCMGVGGGQWASDGVRVTC